MHGASAYKKYQQTQIITGDQKNLILMLYTGAIKFASEAKIKMQKEDMPGKGVAISKAMKIVNELRGSLNHEKGGEIAKQLNDLYLHVNFKLTEANVYNRVKCLEHVILLLTTIKEAWEKISLKQ